MEKLTLTESIYHSFYFWLNDQPIEYTEIVNRFNELFSENTQLKARCERLDMLAQEARGIFSRSKPLPDDDGSEYDTWIAGDDMAHWLNEYAALTKLNEHAES